MWLGDKYSMGAAGSKDEVWVVLPDKKVRSYSQTILAEELMVEFPKLQVSLPLESPDGKNWKMKRVGSNELLTPGKTYFLHSESMSNIDGVMVELMAEKLWTKQRTTSKKKSSTPRGMTDRHTEDLQNAPISTRQNGASREKTLISETALLQQLPAVQFFHQSFNETSEPISPASCNSSRSSFQEIDIASHLEGLESQFEDSDLPEKLSLEKEVKSEFLENLKAKANVSDSLLNHILRSSSQSFDEADAATFESLSMKTIGGKPRFKSREIEISAEDDMMLNGLLSPSATKLKSASLPAAPSDAFRKHPTVCLRNPIPKSKSDTAAFTPRREGRVQFAEEINLEDVDAEEDPGPDPAYHRSATDGSFARPRATNSRSRLGPENKKSVGSAQEGGSGVGTAGAGNSGGKHRPGVAERSQRRWPQKQRKAKTCVDEEFDAILDRFLTQPRGRSKRLMGIESSGEEDEHEGGVDDESDEAIAAKFSKKFSLPPKNRPCSKTGKVLPLPKKGERGSPCPLIPESMDDISLKLSRKGDLADSDSEEEVDLQYVQKEQLTQEGQSSEEDEDNANDFFSFGKQNTVRHNSANPKVWPVSTKS